jgi:translocation and assembly module TamB
MNRKRILIAAGAVAGLLLIAAAAVVMVVRSSWFYEKVRQWSISTVETATGGRVEIGAFQFDWRRMRAKFDNFTLHGDEPAGKPPLLRITSVAAGLRIISVFKRSVDIQYVEATEPHVYLIVYPGGRTNIPEPKVKPTNPKSPVATVLDLAVGRFQLANGQFEVEGRGETPFNLRGQKLNAKLLYDLTGPRYRTDVSIQPLEVTWPGLPTTPVGVSLTADVERNRISLSSVRLTTGDSLVNASGAIENLDSPHASFRYDARMPAADADRLLRTRLLERGAVEVAGQAEWSGPSAFSIIGKVHAFDLDFRGAYVRLVGFRADGTLHVGPDGAGLSNLRLSGNYGGEGPCAAKGGAWPCPDQVSGEVGAASLRGTDLELHNIVLAGLGGSFRGDAHLRNWVAFGVKGEVGGIEVRRAVARYSPVALPWNGILLGEVSVEGMLQHEEEFRATANLVITPAAESAPVFGRITAGYDARTGVLNLGNSTLTLPASRADFSGDLGHQMRVHLESRDLNDFLPALGSSAAAIPVKLANGSAIFDGSVSGQLDDPQIAGHLTATSFSYSGESFDSLQTDLQLSQRNLQVRNASVARGSLHAQFQGSVGLERWSPQPSSPIAGSASIRNAPVTDLLALVKATNLPVAGTLSASGQVSGAVENPVVTADLDVANGKLQDEPFDRFTCHASYGNRLVEISSGRLIAGVKQVSVAGAFQHAPNVFDTGRLHFDVTTNSMPLDQVHVVQVQRPGLNGMVQVKASGDADVAPSNLRLAALNADVSVQGVQYSGLGLGDWRLTAASQGGVLRAHLDSSAAGSTLRGDGQWRLEGDLPGSATITFSKLDFARVQAMLAPGDPDAQHVSGWAEGELRVDGPALKPQLLKAELSIPKLELGPPPDTSGRPLGPAGSLVLNNSGPIVATLSNSTITIGTARLVGRSTDLSVTGRVDLNQQNPLDLRVSGRVDLALLQDFNRDVTSSGVFTADATVRGTLNAPLASGRVEFHDAAFSLVDFPNGISAANGVISFTGGRATIQSFQGETGGGQIHLTGFAAYGNGQTIFRLHARVEQVRVRYPEGVSTVADASLNFTGTPERSMVSGSITVLRTGFNPQSDFSSVLAGSARPVETPAARTGLLGGMSFDIQIDTAPDIEVQTALTQDVQVEANLRLRGTASNPALLGRINITHGQVAFFGTRYTISQGSVAFYNPVRLDPILDIDLETKARGIDITLNVSGPLNKMNLTPRSDPPLQFQEIVALLASGRTPTSDPSLLTQQSSAPQSWQQMGASALLGQAIASPVAGRLQRFFGVSQLRIDPTLPGVENNPQARLTLEQQITPDITFTYITNVTTSNPQVIRMEWAFAKKWSAVLLREENGLFGLDFFFKKRF